jgi:hypothetical protein
MAITYQLALKFKGAISGEVLWKETQIKEVKLERPDPGLRLLDPALQTNRRCR